VAAGIAAEMVEELDSAPAEMMAPDSADHCLLATTNFAVALQTVAVAVRRLAVQGLVYWDTGSQDHLDS